MKTYFERDILMVVSCGHCNKHLTLLLLTEVSLDGVVVRNIEIEKIESFYFTAAMYKY